MDYLILVKKTFQFSDKFPAVLQAISAVMAIVLTICYFYQNVYAIMAIFTGKKKYKKAKTLHKYAYVICAHDEEAVVGQLIQSINQQDYPKELMHIFLVADNCKDNTAEIGRSLGATVFERFSDQKGKSYALDMMVKKLITDYKDEGFEAMFVFDADNLVSKDYTMKMNDVFDSGIKVATSYRESKNYDSSWVSAAASMCFYREATIIHHSRSLLGIGTYVSGTGFYVAMDLLEENGGWDYHTLVEDIEFSYDCAARGIKIGFREDAIFYDEQPITMKASNTQRLRWCKGTHQCFGRYCLTHSKKYPLRYMLSLEKFEMTMHISPVPIISTLWTFMFLVLYGLYCGVNDKGLQFYLDNCFYTVVWFLLSVFGVAFLHALIVVIKKHKQIKAPLWKQLLGCFTFPIYAAEFILLSAIALFKNVSWTKVQHTQSRTIEEMEK